MSKLLSVTMLFLGLIVAAASLAHADIYADRAELARHRKFVATVAAEIANQQFRNRQFIGLVRLFARTHSGLASVPECESLFYRKPSWPYYTNSPTEVRKLCSKGTCVNVHENSLGWNSSLEIQAIYYRETFISSCKIMLRNNLACEFTTTGQNFDFYQANCLDASGKNFDYTNLPKDQRY